MQDREYNIRSVQRKRDFNSTYGTFHVYGLQLDGFPNGQVELNQKPETKPPVVGETIFGHVEARQLTPRNGGEPFTVYRFKKGNPADHEAVAAPARKEQADFAYMIQMLEELTGRRPSPDNPTGRDNVPTDITDGDPFPLDDLPDDLRGMGI